MKTVLETIQSGTPWLEKAGVESPRLNMEHLLAHVLGCKRMELYLKFDRPLSEEELGPLRDLVRRRAKREPLQHLLGTVDFGALTFKTDGRALIPRPETEELVDKLLARWKSLAEDAPPAPRHVLDMGCGSGVIGLSLAHAWPAAQVTLADFSPDALALTQENAAALDLSGDRVRFVRTDLFTALGGQTFDLIVANLPYIGADEMAALSPEVQRDPALALDGGPAGTELIARFLAGVPAHLQPGGLVALEIGAGQSDDLLDVMRKSGLQDPRMVPDYSGRDRFLFAGPP